MLLLLSDGLPETLTASGEPLGYHSFAALLEHDGTTPAAWLDRLLGRLEAVAASGLDDDLTALVLRAG